MKLPDGNILMHGRVAYDPVKAHEYYIRTRQLKGRKSRQGLSPTRKNPLIGDSPVPTYTIKLDTGEAIILTGQQLAEQKAYASKRVKEIKVKLTELTRVLKKAMANAEQKKAKAERQAAKPDTVAEKSKAARESKQYREKHNMEIATKVKKTAAKKELMNDDPVAELEIKFTQIKDTLRTAVASQRALTKATRNK